MLSWIEPPVPLLDPGWKRKSLPENVGKELALDDMNLVRLSQTVTGKVVDSVSSRRR